MPPPLAACHRVSRQVHHQQLGQWTHLYFNVLHHVCFMSHVCPDANSTQIQQLLSDLVFSRSVFAAEQAVADVHPSPAPVTY